MRMLIVPGLCVALAEAADRLSKALRPSVFQVVGKTTYSEAALYYPREFSVRDDSRREHAETHREDRKMAHRRPNLGKGIIYHRPARRKHKTY
jgi:hypothetical protein